MKIEGVTFKSTDESGLSDVRIANKDDFLWVSLYVALEELVLLKDISAMSEEEIIIACRLSN